MLPLRLTLENFMSYRGRQEPLELEGLGVACLAGENGAGKSSLLDALTWALWGRSRVGASADPLVAAGTAEMAVELEFRVGAGRYRVIRRHRKRGGRGRASQTALELQAWDGESYRSLSEPNTRETQRKLIELLRLDYETFINTAFLVQGKADLFTLKPPAERKRLLGDILGLSIYDRLAEHARDEARERETQRRAAQLSGENADRELEAVSHVQSQVEASAIALASLRPQLDAAETERTRLEAEAVRLTRLQDERERLVEESSRWESDRARLGVQRTQLGERIAVAEAVLARRDEIDAGYAALESARNDLDAHGERARRLTLLTSRRGPLEAALIQVKSSLEREIVALETEERSLGSQAEPRRVGALTLEMAEAAKRRDALEAEQREHTERSRSLPEIIERVEGRRAQVRSLRDEDQEIERRLTLLGVEGDGEGSCPLCGSDLGAHGMGQVREHYQQRRGEITVQVDAITVEGMALQGERRALEERVRGDEARLRREMSASDDALGRLRADEQRAASATRDLGGVRQRLADARRRLDEGVYGEEERTALAEVDAEIGGLGYVADAHQASSARAQELGRWDADHRLLQQAAANILQDQESARDAGDALTRVETLLTGSAARLAELAEALGAREETEELLTQARARVGEIREQLEGHVREETRLRSRMEELERRGEERRRLRIQERRAADEKSVYEELATAFGVRGVQALLIETALPELEEEANALLARMTDNRMHLRLATQRETQGGGQQETLDLIIGDEWGTRPYELYSGGEAFRINFALRIALSKLLARRAGAEVPVLFIDEGFGSQDAVGRDRLVETISALWEDPAFHDGLILVITHIDEIKNQFDVRIEVTKTEQGSRFQVVS